MPARMTPPSPTTQPCVASGKETPYRPSPGRAPTRSRWHRHPPRRGSAAAHLPAVRGVGEGDGGERGLGLARFRPREPTPPSVVGRIGALPAHCPGVGEAWRKATAISLAPVPDLCFLQVHATVVGGDDRAVHAHRPRPWRASAKATPRSPAPVFEFRSLQWVPPSLVARMVPSSPAHSAVLGVGEGDRVEQGSCAQLLSLYLPRRPPSP